MATITRFEEINAWKKARELTREIYKATQSGAFARDFGLRDQIRRAAVSVMSNIAEGYERSGNTEFRQFLYIAKGSAGEVRSQMYVALDAGYVNHDEFDRLTKLAVEVSLLISSFIRYLDQSGMKGSKYVSD